MLNRNPIDWYDRKWSGSDSGSLSLNDGERLKKILAMIPPHARTILDVGCGDGRVTNSISAQGFKVLALDISMQGLKKVKGLRVLGDSSQLPLRDECFDLVICSEVLEHLPEGALDHTVEELKRVSGRYILVTVPYEERLELSLIRCEGCLSIFHPVLHLRSFTRERLSALFPSHAVLQTATSGVEPYRSSILTGLLRLTVGYNVSWDEVSRLCPVCGNTVRVQSASDSPLSFVLMKLMALVARVMPKKPYHMEALLERRDLSGAGEG